MTAIVSGPSRGENGFAAVFAAGEASAAAATLSALTSRGNPRAIGIHPRAPPRRRRRRAGERPADGPGFSSR